MNANPCGEYKQKCVFCYLLGLYQAQLRCSQGVSTRCTAEIDELSSLFGNHIQLVQISGSIASIWKKQLWIPRTAEGAVTLERSASSVAFF